MSRVVRALGIGAVVAACAGPAAPRTDELGGATGSGAADASAGAGAGADAGGGAAACDDARTPPLAWPLDGALGVAWVTSNFVDLDPAPGAMRDYAGTTGETARTYDTHDGVDIGIPSFRAMDRGVPVRAVADGVVVVAHDGEPDRQRLGPSCGVKANDVVVRLPSGNRTRYTHLAKGSVAVKVGDTVTAGQQLGLVGSSGCSTGPHLHFELIGCDAKTHDPFLESRWATPPPYELPKTLFDVALRKGRFDTPTSPLDEPPADATTFAVGDEIGFLMLVVGAVPGDVLATKITRGDGSTFATSSFTAERKQARTRVHWYRTLAGAPGRWTLTFTINGAEARALTFDVTP